MQVSSRVILSSAEGIVRDRREDTRPTPGLTGSAGSAPHRSPDTSLRQDVLQARLLDLEAVLNRTQSQYTREQTRNTYLTIQPDAVSRSLTFDGEPLFPELESGVAPGAILADTRDRMSRLTRAMKGIQVEMENLLALGSPSVVPKSLSAAELLGSGGLKELDPDRVARLTRG